MHEYTLAQSILNTARDAAQGQKITRINLEIGEIADIPPADLISTLKDICDYAIDFTETESHVKCSCGYEGRAKIVEKKHSVTIFVCPKCGKIPQVISGKEIKITDIEVED